MQLVYRNAIDKKILKADRKISRLGMIRVVQDIQYSSSYAFNLQIVRMNKVKLIYI